MELLYKAEVFTIIGCAIDVHRNLGPGFLESVYPEALCREFLTRGIPFEAGKQVDILYKGNVLDKKFIADLVCFQKIIVELKAVETLSKRDEGQLLNYLTATGLRLGLLINFGSFPRLDWKRLIL